MEIHSKLLKKLIEKVKRFILEIIFLSNWLLEILVWTFADKNILYNLFKLNDFQKYLTAKHIISSNKILMHKNLTNSE